MATTVSTAKPSTPYHAAGGKVKRPPPPQQSSSSSSIGPANAQAGAAGVNGVKAQTAQTTAGNKPSGAKQMQSNAGGVVMNGVNGKNATGAAARTKKDSLKNGDAVARLLRATGRTGGEGERRGKIPPEPCVKSTGYILRKYKGCQPSFTIHLHPTHFRFDQQDGSFSYNSEMKFIIEHIKAGTVPHDMVEELIKGGVRFYEGCLIVRIIDHKTVATRSDTKSPSGEKIVPFSLHNYNSHITPSPYAPFPKQAQKHPNARLPSIPSAADTGKSADAPANDTQLEKDKDKSAVNGAPKPKVYTTVLHPTPLSLQAEITLCALTPDPRAPKKQRPSQANGSSSAQPSGRPAKRQKMMVEPDELPEFEAKLIRATAPPLYLEPVDSRESCQKLLDMLQSPLHCNKPPSPKVRRRTVAELAADEAAAAEQERFMLIMDERLELAASSSASAPKSAVVDDEGGAAPFEPRFSRFKTLENIRAQHEEKAKREHERKLQQDQAKRQQQDAEREKRRILEARQASEAAREETRKQYLAQQQAQQQQAQQAFQNQAQAQAAQAQMAARRPPSQGSAAGFPQQMVSTQGAQSSPIVRNATPHAGSPLAAGMMGTQPGQMPTTMGMTTQGAGSPLQVSAGLQHGHPGAMSHPMMASRSQQGQSAHGTPQMAHGTPSIPHSTPIMSHSTPQRMTHASPNGSAVAPTPVMNMPMGGQMNGPRMLTAQQQQAIMARQLQLAQQGLGGPQFSPQQLAQLQAQQNMQQQQQQQQQHPGMQFTNQQQAYQAQILRSQLAQMQMSQQGQHPQQQMLAANQQANGMGQPRPKAANPYHFLYNSHLLRLRREWIQQHLDRYGSQPQAYPPHIRKQFYEVTDAMAKRIVTEVMRKDREEGNPRSEQLQQIQAQQRLQAQAQAQVMQQQQQQQQMMSGMVNGMGK